MGKLHGEELKRVNLLEINVDPEEFFWKLMAEVKKTYKLGIIHGDLSEFNILIDSEGDFVIIDWPQAIEVGKKGKLDKLPFEEVEYDEEFYLKRDIENVVRYFKKYGIDKDIDKLYNYVIGDITSENI
jgi:RIO kinase 2